MTQITLQIPDDELDNPFELTQQQKDLLDHRRVTESVFLSVEEANLKIKLKYGLSTD